MQRMLGKTMLLLFQEHPFNPVSLSVTRLSAGLH